MAGREVRVERVGDQRVREPQRPPGISGVDEQAGAGCRVQRGAHFRLGRLGQLDQHILGEVDAEDRRRMEDSGRRVAEGAYPTPHHLEQAAGDGVVQILNGEADLTSSTDSRSDSHR